MNINRIQGQIEKIQKDYKSLSDAIESNIEENKEAHDIIYKVMSNDFQSLSDRISEASTRVTIQSCELNDIKRDFDVIENTLKEVNKRAI